MSMNSLQGEIAEEEHYKKLEKLVHRSKLRKKAIASGICPDCLTYMRLSRNPYGDEIDFCACHQCKTTYHY